jgi:hypothetical protein
MAIEMARLPEGTRVRIRLSNLPQEPGVTGRLGTVVAASDYTANRLGVKLDGDDEVRMFAPAELEVVEAVPLPPEREKAKTRPALP